MNIIEAEGISYSYGFDGFAEPALDGVCLAVEKGEFLAILGRNGSGKSTLIKHFNALLPLQEGRLTVAGIDAGDPRAVWRLRRLCGMVFQNPGSQFISTVLEEDIAFGLENYQTPAEEIPKKVKEALELAGLGGYEKRQPQTLSGGEKQRAALAGVLVLDPEILLFDEAAAMLDPLGRREVLEVIRRLHREEGKTIIMVTHYAEEAVYADTVCLMDRGKILARGPVREVFAHRELLDRAGLVPPVPVRLWHDLSEAGILPGTSEPPGLPGTPGGRRKWCPLTGDELADVLTEELCRSK